LLACCYAVCWLLNTNSEYFGNSLQNQQSV
jgi:hypothetical protein